MDATTLEVNAALRSIVRRDTGKSYEQYLHRLAEASGITTPSREELAKFDKGRKHKGDNDDWQHPHDPDARITKMKDGRTHLAHKAEQAVDLGGEGAVLHVEVRGADEGDTQTLGETIVGATEQLGELAADGHTSDQLHERWMSEVVADKGYHSNETMVMLDEMTIRGYVSEPNRGRRRWRGKREAREAVYANRRRVRGDRGKRLLRQRGERLERPFAHYLDPGGMRHCHLRGRQNILKRLLIQVAGFNLGVLMRRWLGAGTPRELCARFGRLILNAHALLALILCPWLYMASHRRVDRRFARLAPPPAA